MAKEHTVHVPLTATEDDENTLVAFEFEGKKSIITVRDGKIVFTGDLPVEESAKQFFYHFGAHCAHMFSDFFVGTHTHVKSQGVYEEVGRGKLEMSVPKKLKEGDVLVAYKNPEGEFWFRHEAEFDDGRFEDLPPDELDEE